MKLEDWKKKEKEFLEMQDKQKANLILVQNTLEEIDLFLTTIREKIRTFK